MTIKLKNTRFVLVSTLVVCIILLVAGCTTQSPQSDTSSEVNTSQMDASEKDETQTNQDNATSTNRVLKIASVHFPPFEVIENGEFSGPGYDILHEAFKRMGYSTADYELVEFPWARTLEMIKDGDVDIILDISKNEERATYIDYSSESFTQYDKNFIALDGLNTNYDGTIESIKNFNIGVVREYRIGPNYQDARASGDYKFEDASSFDENIEKLLLGRVPIILDTKFSVQQHMKHIGSTIKLQVLEPAYDSTTTYIGFSKKLEDKSIIDAYDKAVRSMKDDGTFQAILDKYFN